MNEKRNFFSLSGIIIPNSKVSTTIKQNNFFRPPEINPSKSTLTCNQAERKANLNYALVKGKIVLRKNKGSISSQLFYLTKEKKLKMYFNNESISPQIKKIIERGPNEDEFVLSNNSLSKRKLESSMTPNAMNFSCSSDNLNRPYLNNNCLFRAVCILCDLSLENGIDIIKLENCGHFICTTCFKIYFQSKANEKDLYCPLSQCHKKITNELIVNDIIHRGNSDEYTKKIKTQYIFPERIKTSVENFSQKNVINVSNSNSDYITYAAVKQKFCPNCCSTNLFTIPSWRYVKCLNCIKYFCKYCFKEILPGHFNKYNRGSCKLHLKHYLKKKTQSFCNKFLMEVLFATFGYILYYLMVSRKLYCLKGKKHCFLTKLLLSLFYVVLLTSWSVFFVVCIPYYYIFVIFIDTVILVSRKGNVYY